MAVLVVHVGQCGNQLAAAFWPQLHEQWQRGGGGRNALLHNGRARAVFVDTEPKVLAQLLAQDRHQLILPDNVVHEQGGRGNNWAMGYFGPRWARRKAPPKQQFSLHSGGGNAEPEPSDLVFRAMARIERECERAGDALEGVLVLHSLAGGTGSGLGCRLTECIREAHPDVPICNVVVAAFQSGEVPLQHLNATLCLGHLQRCSSAIVLFSNQEVFAALDPAGQRSLTLMDLNEYICSCLLQCLRWGQEVGALPQLIRHLAPDPTMKVLTMAKYPSAPDQLPPEEHMTRWTDFFDRACGRLPRWDGYKRRVWTLQAHLRIVTNEPTNTLQRYVAQLHGAGDGPEEVGPGGLDAEGDPGGGPGPPTAPLSPPRGAGTLAPGRPTTPRRASIPLVTAAPADPPRPAAGRRGVPATAPASSTAASDQSQNGYHGPVIRPGAGGPAAPPGAGRRGRRPFLDGSPGVPAALPAPSSSAGPSPPPHAPPLRPRPAAATGALRKGDVIDVVTALRKLTGSLSLVGAEEAGESPRVAWSFAAQPRTKVADPVVRREVVLCCNHTGVAATLHHALDRAVVLYHAEAYVHWYKRHGATAETFERAFRAVQGMVDRYYAIQSMCMAAK